MAKKKDGERRGHPCDPDIPISIEVHCYFWHEAAARFAPKGLDQFWSRRIERRLEDINFPALEPTDNLAYAALMDSLAGKVLPKKDGFTVLEELRGQESTADIPVIILSNYGEKELVDRGLKLGAMEFLVKAQTSPIVLSEGIDEWLKE